MMHALLSGAEGYCVNPGLALELHCQLVFGSASTGS